MGNGAFDVYLNCRGSKNYFGIKKEKESQLLIGFKNGVRSDRGGQTSCGVMYNSDFIYIIDLPPTVRRFILLNRVHLLKSMPCT